MNIYLNSSMHLCNDYNISTEIFVISSNAMEIKAIDGY